VTELLFSTNRVAKKVKQMGETVAKQGILLRISKAKTEDRKQEAAKED